MAADDSPLAQDTAHFDGQAYAAEPLQEPSEATPYLTDEYPASDMPYDPDANQEYVPEELIESLDDAEDVDDEELIMEPARLAEDDEFER
jgi:hypothetical protein